MKKTKFIFLTGLFIILFYLLAIKNNSISAQSPIRCGLLNEPCCNLAGGPPNSCQTGLICSNNNRCVDDPNSDVVPPTRGSANDNPNLNSSPLKGDCIDTAIGCIPIEQEGFVTFILRWAIGIGGGIAFILIIIASFQIMTSQGDPKRLQAGKELLSSAIMGLILLIFSVFILRIIGVNILKIPGFS
jgi:hypothetical protein